MQAEIRSHETKGRLPKRVKRHWLAGLWIVLWAFWGPSVQAEIFYNQDGIQFQGSIRTLAYNAYTCNVLEEKHSAEEYEKIKAYQGQPLHIWQVDYSVYNGSGKTLSYLRAQLDVESNWPPCDNWDRSPDLDFHEFAEWTGRGYTIGMPHGMRLNQVEQETDYLLVFHTEQPWIGRWDIKYTFDDDPTPGGSRQTRQESPQPRSRQPVPQPEPAPIPAPKPAPAVPVRERLPYEPEMVEIPGGSFRMGCVSGRDCYDREQPVHEVRVEAFELSKYEVTFEEYDRFTSATGRERADDNGWGRGRRPVIIVSWEDAVAYTQWLSQQTGERYRLPTEAEWEYAARAGTVTKYSWGNEIGRNRANCDRCGSQWDVQQTAPVGSFAPNGWGLHDMHGNVREWVQDCWNGNYQGAPSDGSAWESGDCSQRVLRGGSWFYFPRNLRSAIRYRITASFRSNNNGFRVARTVTP